MWPFKIIVTVFLSSLGCFFSGEQNSWTFWGSLLACILVGADEPVPFLLVVDQSCGLFCRSASRGQRPLSRRRSPGATALPRLRLAPRSSSSASVEARSTLFSACVQTGTDMHTHVLKFLPGDCQTF